jgi:hypothetical protein
MARAKAAVTTAAVVKVTATTTVDMMIWLH